MKLVLATGNVHKAVEIRAILGERFGEILTMKEAGLDLDIEETGDTFAQNALIKAQAVADALGCAALADDSGLAVDALGGQPGVYSARYAGPQHNDQDNIEKLLTVMEPVPDDQRQAQFCCAMALVRPGRPPLVVEGTCCGQILHELRGQDGFGYDPLFYVPERGCTMAELAPEEKNALSHRRRALDALVARLEEEA